MDKANFEFAYNGKIYAMENMVLTIHNGEDGSSYLSDPEYCEYELAIRVAELMEENSKIFEKNTELRSDLTKEKERTIRQLGKPIK